MKHLEDNNTRICKAHNVSIRAESDNLLISDSQHGFRRGRSCLTNLLTFLDKVTSYVDTGNDVDVVFLDFAKAFDKVPYMRLLQKLKSHGIDGKLLRWITYWLSSRTQRVCINGMLSDWKVVLSCITARFSK